MRWRVTLLLCLLSVAALMLVVPSTLATRRDAGERSTRPLLSAEEMPAERVDEIAIERPRASPILLRRSGESWTEESPSGLAVDPFAVRELIAAIHRLVVSRSVAVGEASDDRARLLGDLALSPAEATVTLRSPDGEVSLRLGRLGVAGRAFAQRSDRPDEVVVVGQELHALVLQQDPASWRVRSLFPEAGAETSRIEYLSGEATLRLVRVGDVWRMELPVATRVDPTAMAAYLSALARAEISGFLGDLATPERAAECGLAPPQATITVQGVSLAASPTAASTSELRDTTLAVGRAITVGGDDRFGALEGHPVLLRLSKPTLQSLFVSPPALIAPTACAVLPADVKRVRLEGPDGAFSLLRDLDRWIAPDASDANVEPARVDELFRRLTSAQASAILLKPIPRDLLLGRIELFGFDGTLLAEIEIGADPARAQYALEAGDGVARVFPASSAPALNPEAYGLPASAATRPAK